MGTGRKSLFVIAMIVLAEQDLFPFRRVGFHCGDPKIAYKFAGDTITVITLLTVTLAVPLAVVLLVEVMLVADDKEGTRQMKKKLLQAWQWYSQYIFGLLLLLFFVTMSKSLVSSPRPHFLDTCRPDKAINCTVGYITDFICTNTLTKKSSITDSMRSFPSGHSAIGFYLAVFLMCFIHQRTSQRQTLIVPWLHCIFLLWAMTCASTRVTDRRHHWWDVVFGSFCGIVVAIYVVTGMCRGFRVSRFSDKQEVSSSESSVGSNKTSSRRLLSSTSSYLPTEEKDMGVLS